MSLLMDALKRAETSKQDAARSLAGGEATTAHSEKLSLEPLPTGRPKGQINPLPELATHIETVDADLAFVPRPEIPAASRAAPISPTALEKLDELFEREAVRNAFKAKLSSEPPSKRPLWLALGILGFAAVAISAYVWYQLSNMGSNNLVAPNSRAPASSQPSQMVQSATVAAVPALPINPPSVYTPSSASTAANRPMDNKTTLFPPSRPESRPSRAPMAASEAGAGVPIRLTRSRPEADVNLLRGHANVQRNELELARRDFEQTIQRDPNNTDALLALAAIAQRQGRSADAERFNQQALVANPGDGAVQAAALSGAAAGADPQTTESRLKTLLAAQPESAQLNFALGNLYSRQKRWSEAQQVYFNAVAADADNPDYLFNLAVSLDHLRQNRPAAQHYRLALEAANKRPAAFDREQITRRLNELQPGSPLVLQPVSQAEQPR